MRPRCAGSNQKRAAATRRGASSARRQAGDVPSSARRPPSASGSRTGLRCGSRGRAARARLRRPPPRPSGAGGPLMAISYGVLSSRRASAPSAISSVACGPMMCRPRRSFGVLVGDHLGEAFVVPFDQRLGVRPHRELADLDLVAELDRFLLGQADAADLRLAIGAGRRIENVDREGVEPGDMLDGRRCPGAWRCGRATAGR